MARRIRQTHETWADASGKLDIDALEEYVGRVAATELARCGVTRGWTPSVPARRWRSAGHTYRRFALLNLAGPTGVRKVMVLITPPAHWHEPGELGESVYGAVRSQCPPAFLPHLILEAEPACTTSNGEQITFLELAGGDVHGCLPLRDLPKPLLRETLRIVPAALLRDWNRDRFGVRRLTVADMVRKALGQKLHELQRWAEHTGMVPHQTPWIEYGDGGVCPNPLVLAEPDSLLGRHPIDVLVGRCHRDLHLGSILMPDARRGSVDPARFLLVDLDRYHPEWPLSTDPVALMLSAVAHTLPSLPVQEWESLAEALVTGIGTDRFAMVHAVVQSAEDAVRSASPSLLGDWRWQVLISTIAAALTYTTLHALDAQRREWFFRLAALGSRRVIQDLGENLPPDAVRIGSLFGHADGSATTDQFEVADMGSPEDRAPQFAPQMQDSQTLPGLPEDEEAAIRMILKVSPFVAARELSRIAPGRVASLLRISVERIAQILEAMDPEPAADILIAMDRYQAADALNCMRQDAAVDRLAAMEVVRREAILDAMNPRRATLFRKRVDGRML
jgi:hypothetical protein